MSKRTEEYQAERLRRASLRKEKRKSARQSKYFRYGRPSESECPRCGGQMTWCNCCQMWSMGCCCEYGSCECS